MTTFSRGGMSQSPGEVGFGFPGVSNILQIHDVDSTSHPFQGFPCPNRGSPAAHRRDQDGTIMEGWLGSLKESLGGSSGLLLAFLFGFEQCDLAKHRASCLAQLQQCKHRWKPS